MPRKKKPRSKTSQKLLFILSKEFQKENRRAKEILHSLTGKSQEKNRSPIGIYHSGKYQGGRKFF